MKLVHFKFNLVEIIILAILPLFADAVFADCKEDNWDVFKVAKAVQQGLSKEDLVQHLEGSRHLLTPERMSRIRERIEEAYQLEQTEAERWWHANTRDCNGQETWRRGGGYDVGLVQ